jgi:hypothetical protein
MKKCLVLVVLAVMALPVMADDIYPPNVVIGLPDWQAWNRGAPLSATAAWDFVSATNPAAPDDPGVPVILPSNTSAAAMAINLQWTTDFGGKVHDGWYAPGENGQLVIDMPNWIDEQPVKYLRIQMTYDGPNGASTPTMDIVGHDPQGCLTTFIGQVDEVRPDGQQYTISMWKIIPNPDSEQITVTIPAGLFIDEIVVDTISIPEPATMALVGLGVLGLLRRRRK